MKPYLVELTVLAVKDLKTLSTIEEEISGHLRELRTNPEKGHGLSQNLQGVRALEFLIKGSGDYRAAYVIQEEARKVTVFLVGPRENFYDEAARRVKLLTSLLKKVRAANREKSRKKKDSAEKPKKA